MPQQPLLLEATELAKHYPAAGARLGSRRNPPALKAVDGVSLHIRRGEVLGLVGESGSGKSTTGRMIAGLEAPTAGTVRFAGQPLESLRSRELATIRRRIQYVFQDPYASLNPWHRIGAILEEPLHVHRLGDRRERAERVRTMLDVVGLPQSSLDKFPHELSGGQRQRVGIARALMLQPELLVLDEPVSALDVSVQSQILNLLKELQHEFSLTYLFISHDLNVVHYMSDRVAVMYFGRIVESAPVEQLYHSPRHPYTSTLLSSIPLQSPDQRSVPFVLAGEPPDLYHPPQGCAFHPRCPLATDWCRQAAPPSVTLSGADQLHEQHHQVSCHLYREEEQR